MAARDRDPRQQAVAAARREARDLAIIRQAFASDVYAPESFVVGVRERLAREPARQPIETES
jgi:hypothetical protein